MHIFEWPDSPKFANLPILSPFTIPSGIITTRPSIISRIARDIDQIGFLTTKTISVTPREGYREPIIHEYWPGCFVNAVGLANPGAKAFIEEMAPLKPLHNGKPLFVSIMGISPEEFLECAEILDQIADAFELNLSCPHVKGAGQSIGSDVAAVERIITGLRRMTSKPIIPKLSPNLGNLVEMAELCQASGADGLCLINTVGPGRASDEDGFPVLTNENGGISGAAVLPIGLKIIREISQRVQIPIVAAGGISCAGDVVSYGKAGASYFSVGSALVGLTTSGLKEFFVKLDQDLQAPNGTKRKMIRISCATEYAKTKVILNDPIGDQMFRILLNCDIECDPGAFFFLRAPGVGEKPFSPGRLNPLEFYVRTVGPFTRHLESLQPGDELFVRGPYGRGFPEPGLSSIVVIGGGTGIAPILMAAKKWSQQTLDVILGFSREITPAFRLKLAKDSTAIIAIDDPNVVGSAVHELQRRLEANYYPETTLFYVCGPSAMMSAAVDAISVRHPMDSIYIAREDIMRCGIGICGSCGTKTGLRSCVDGPVMNADK